jgi:hypothetical protein
MESVLRLDVAVFLLGLALPVQGPPSSQAGVRGDAPYRCNFAKVTVPLASKGAVVRVHPRPDSSERDRLPSDQGVYVCDEHRYWYQIFYGPPGTPCGSTATGDLDVREARKCKSGWISRRLVKVLSG